MMAEYFDITPAELPAKTVEDPRAAVASDIAMLRATPAIPPTILVSGLVYDTETGLIEVVVPLAPNRPEQKGE
jgi:carbonic anhydrase